MYFLKVFYVYYVIIIKYDIIICTFTNNVSEFLTFLASHNPPFCLFTLGTHAHVMVLVFPKRYCTSETVNQCLM